MLNSTNQLGSNGTPSIRNLETITDSTHILRRKRKLERAADSPVVPDSRVPKIT